MRTTDEVQTALIEYLKAQASLTVLLASANEIKEPEWQGADFVYPAVRVENTIHPNKMYCAPDDVDITVYCLSEKKSSLQCSRLASAVAQLLHNRSGLAGSNGVRFVFLRVVEIPYPAQQEGQSIWISAVKIVTQVI